MRIAKTLTAAVAALALVTAVAAAPSEAQARRGWGWGPAVGAGIAIGIIGAAAAAADEGSPTGIAFGSQSFWPGRLASQNTRPMKPKKISTVIETTCVAKPSVGVNASGEVSRTTP